MATRKTLLLLCALLHAASEMHIKAASTKAIIFFIKNSFFPKMIQVFIFYNKKTMNTFG